MIQMKFFTPNQQIKHTVWAQNAYRPLTVVN